MCRNGSKNTVSVGTDSESNLIRLDDRTRAEHTYVLGKSGTGKTMFLCNLIAQDLNRGACVVFLDPIGTGVPYLKRLVGVANLQAMMLERSPKAGMNTYRRQRRQERLSRITFMELDRPDFPHRFNPLEPVDWMSTAEQAQAFAASMERLLQGDLAQMRQLLLNLVALASILIETGGATVADMIELLCMDSHSLEEYIRRLDRLRSDGRLHVPVRPDLIRQYMTGFFSQTSGRERRDLVASTLRALMMLLTDPVAARLLSAPTGNLDLDAVMHRGHSLLGSMPPHNLHTQATVNSLFLSRITAMAMRRDSLKVQEGHYPQVNLVVDEFQTIFNQENAEETAVLRNKGVALVLAHQSGSQPPFHTPEGRAMLESVRDNCSLSVYFRMGRLDALDLAPGCYEPDGRMVKLRREEVSVTQSASTGQTTTHSTQETQGENLTHSHAHAEGESEAQGHAASTGTSSGRQRGTSRGRSKTDGTTHTTGINRGEGRSHSSGHQHSFSQGSGGAESRSDSQTDGQSTGSASSQSQQTSHSLTVALRPNSPGTHLIGGYQQAQSSGEGQSDSRNWGTSHSSTHATARARSWQQNRSHGTSESQGHSRQESRSQATGRSHSQSESETESESESTSETHTDSSSTTQTQSRTNTATTSEGSTRTTGSGQAHGTSVGQSSGQTTREVVEHYSVSEEAAIRSYELMSLPNRTAIVLQRGRGPLQRDLIHTLDMPTELVTRVGTLDGLADLERLTTPPPPSDAPGLGILDRLRLRQLELAEGSEE
jgi:hypothetical protein